MFRILIKSIQSYVRTSKPHKLFIQKYSSKNIYENQDSFTVGYLINQFGFSLQKAVLASKKLRFKNRDKPDAVVSFFKNHGFSDTQIRKLISGYCKILICNPEKILLPKIEFFRSRGVSSTDLARITEFNYALLTRSLKKHIVPGFNYLKDLIGSDERVVRMLEVDSRLLTQLEYRVKPNIEILRGVGVPYSKISCLLKYHSCLFTYPSHKLNKSIELVQNLGMEPKKISYSLAVLVICTTSKWNDRMKAYTKWGCSEDEVLTSFRILPYIMALSVERLDGIMSFCVNEMGLDPPEVVRRYYLFTLSLNKRIIPRWLVYKELVSKRLIKDTGKVRSMFQMKEDLFLEKYLNRYKDEAPLLLKLYLDKLEASK